MRIIANDDTPEFTRREKLAQGFDMAMYMVIGFLEWALPKLWEAIQGLAFAAVFIYAGIMFGLVQMSVPDKFSPWIGMGNPGTIHLLVDILFALICTIRLNMDKTARDSPQRMALAAGLYVGFFGFATVMVKMADALPSG